MQTGHSMKAKVRANVVQAKDCYDPADYVLVHKDRLAALKVEIRQLGEMGNVCTYSTLKTICSGCRCGKQQATPSGCAP